MFGFEVFVLIASIVAKKAKYEYGVAIDGGSKYTGLFVFR